MYQRQKTNLARRFFKIDDNTTTKIKTFCPMENGEFIAQMAQFSTVTGITSMDESLKM